MNSVSNEEYKEYLGSLLVSTLMQSNEETNDLIIYIDKLVKGDADLNYKDSKTGNTALMITVLKNFPNSFRIIINKKQNLESTNFYGATVTHLASSNEDSFYLSELCSKNVDCDAPDKDGNRPINYAIKAGCVKNIDILFKNNCTKNFLNKYGLSIYDEANLSGHEEVISFLFQPKRKNEHKLKRIIEVIRNIPNKD